MRIVILGERRGRGSKKTCPLEATESERSTFMKNPKPGEEEILGVPEKFIIIDRSLTRAANESRSENNGVL